MDNKIDNLVPPDIYSEENDKILPLDVTLKSQFERVFGADFSSVKIHIGHFSDRLTRESGAFAVTTGNDIYFANGLYSPETIAGIKLLAHELQHVVQFQNDRSTKYSEDIDALEADATEIEMLFDDLMLHEINSSVIENSSVSHIDQSEAVTKTTKLKKDSTNDEVIGLDVFTQKDSSLNYTIILPSNEKIEIKTNEYNKFKQILKKQVIDYYNSQKNQLTNEEWEYFVIKFYNFLKK